MGGTHIKQIQKQTGAVLQVHSRKDNTQSSSFVVVTITGSMQQKREAVYAVMEEIELYRTDQVS